MAADLVIGWSIFAVVLLAILAFCWVYIRKYQSCQESEAVSTITAIFSLAVALITSALLPVDIFLVSFMKNENGTFKGWAEDNTTRARIEDTILIGYYTNSDNSSLESIVKKKPFKNFGEIHKAWTAAGVSASRATTHRLIWDMGHNCRIPYVKPFVTQKQNQKTFYLG